MIRSLVFDKDGVILDLVGTWFPVVEKLVDYTHLIAFLGGARYGDPRQPSCQCRRRRGDRTDRPSWHFRHGILHRYKGRMVETDAARHD